MGIKGAVPSARLFVACANANPASRMARSMGGRSYSTTFLVLVSESICSLLNRLAQRAQIQFWAEHQHTGTRCHAPPGSRAFLPYKYLNSTARIRNHEVS